MPLEGLLGLTCSVFKTWHFDLAGSCGLSVGRCLKIGGETHIIQQCFEGKYTGLLKIQVQKSLYGTLTIKSKFLAQALTPSKKFPRNLKANCWIFREHVYNFERKKQASKPHFNEYEY